MLLLLTRDAEKGLRKLQPARRRSMLDRLNAIAADPFAPHANVAPLKGEPDAFRLRQGDWRAVYKVDRERDRIVVSRIEPRGGVYR
jgi:mRNA interferase RelE/StbE